MKNLVKTLAFGAIVAASFTACHNEEGVSNVPVNNVVITSARVLVVRANTSATFTLGSETKTGTEVTFNTSASTGTVNITATGKKAMTLNFDFNGGNYLEREVELVSNLDPAQVIPAATAEAPGADAVSNGTVNAQENGGVTAEFSVAGNTNNGVTGDYSVMVFSPASADVDIENAEKNDPIEESLLALDCQPDGAIFATPITVDMNIPGSDGYDITCVSENGDMPDAVTHVGDKLSITLGHFSIWDIVLNATLKDVQTTELENNYTGNAADGSIKYNFNFGFESDATSSIVNKFLKKLFGVAKKSVEKTATFNKFNGTAILNVKQEVTTYTFEAGKEFTVTVYGSVKENLTLEVQPDDATEVKTHDGGTTSKH